MCVGAILFEEFGGGGGGGGGGGEGLRVVLELVKELTTFCCKSVIMHGRNFKPSHKTDIASSNL